MPDVVMSIHPEWAAKIYSWEKKIEWRKTKPRHYDSKMKVYLYETAPVKKYHREACRACPIAGTGYCHRINPGARKYTHSEKVAIRERLDAMEDAGQ